MSQKYIFLFEYDCRQPFFTPYFYGKKKKVLGTLNTPNRRIFAKTNKNNEHRIKRTRIIKAR